MSVRAFLMDIRALCVLRTHMPVRAFLMDHSGDNWNPLASPYWATLCTQWNITVVHLLLQLAAYKWSLGMEPLNDKYSLKQSVNQLIFFLSFVGPKMHQSNTSHAWTILRVGWQLHQSTSQTPPTRCQSMYAIQIKSLFLGLFQVGPQDSSEIPHVEDPCMQSRTIPSF